MTNKKEKSPFVDIASVLGGISLVIVLFLLIFAPSQAWVAILVVLVLALLGMYLGKLQKDVLLGKKK